jgi:DNA invertase Pin-like site-specific DNA recombinase
VSDGDGLGVQRQRIEGWCSFQGIPLGNIYEDAGISGASMDNRPGFRSAVRAALEAGENGVLVTYRLDRLGRSAIDVQQVLEVLLDAKVRVVSIADGVDSGSGMGSMLLRLLTGLLATLAEAEKAGITSRLLDGRQRAKAMGRVYAVEPPFGSSLDPNDEGRMVPDAREQLVLERMRVLHADGKSLRSIAVTLDAEGLHPRRAERWSHVTIRSIVTGQRSRRRTHSSERVARARAHLLGEPAV